MAISVTTTVLVVDDKGDIERLSVSEDMVLPKQIKRYAGDKVFFIEAPWGESQYRNRR